MPHKDQMWNDENHALVSAVLDQLIPQSANGRIPSAGSVGTIDYIEAQSEADPGTLEQYSQGLRALEEIAEEKGVQMGSLEPEVMKEVTSKLEEAKPDFFALLLRHTYMGYYTNPSIPQLFGLTSTAPQPEGYEVPDNDPDVLAEMVGPVIARGNCYLDAGTTDQTGREENGK